MRRDENIKTSNGFTVNTNPRQVFAIVIMFLAMFVFPIQVYTLYKNGTFDFKKPLVLGASTTNTSVQNDKFLGIIDLDYISKYVGGNTLLYIGIALGVLVLVEIVVLFLSFKKSRDEE